MESLLSKLCPQHRGTEKLKALEVAFNVSQLLFLHFVPPSFFLIVTDFIYTHNLENFFIRCRVEMIN